LVDSKKKLKKLKQKLLAAENSKKTADLPKDQAEKDTKEIKEELISQLELETINIETIITDRATIERQENTPEIKAEPNKLENLTLTNGTYEENNKETNSYFSVSKQEDYQTYKMLDERDSPKEETSNRPEFKERPDKDEEQPKYIQPKYH
jgi:hypothetical protein